MKRLGVVMDPIAQVKAHKDSTLAMLLEAQRRGLELLYIEPQELYLRDGVPYAAARAIEVRDDPNDWYTLRKTAALALAELDVLLMRKDPPFDAEYIYATYILEQAEARGTLVVNRPQSLRDANEKVFTAWFPQCTPPTLVTRSAGRIVDFAAEHGEIVLKPLDAMGGSSIFRLRQDDPNFSVVLETMTQAGRRSVMAQRFVAEISAGDKRILVIDGQAFASAVSRVPAAGDFRGNLAAGAQAVGATLSERDRWLCEQVGPALRERGLLFVGIDVIGDYITEINVTSPTGIREIDRLFDTNVSAQLLDAIARKRGTS